MDFLIPKKISNDIQRFKKFISKHLEPNLATWLKENEIPRQFYNSMGKAGWFSFRMRGDELIRQPALREALIMEELAKHSPGVAIITLAISDLGLLALHLFASDAVKQKYAEDAVSGNTLICLGNTESHAGSDVANISMTAKKTKGGWLLNGTKSYVTNGYISDLAVITAVSVPEAPRNNRISMFLADLNSEGIKKTRLKKNAWMPSDLTRISFKDVFVPKDHLLGEEGKGLQQVLTIFTNSRVPISALTLGTAKAAFTAALKHASKRKVFGQRLADFQAKSFEIADLYSKMEAARLMLLKACWMLDSDEDFRLEASMAKYLSVKSAREIVTWATDLFGAASVMSDHPVHNFPLDIWASSVGEGTQDIQKLIIFREVMKTIK